MDEDILQAQDQELLEFNAVEPPAPAASPAPETPAPVTAPAPAVAAEPEVEIIPDPRGPDPVDPKRKDYSHVDKTPLPPEVQARINQLVWQAKNNERAAEQAKRERDALAVVAKAMAARSKQQAEQQHKLAGDALLIGREKTKGDMESAKAALAAAYANGDAAAQAEASARLARAAAEDAQISSVTMSEKPIEPAEIEQFNRLQESLQQQQQPSAAELQQSQQAQQLFMSWRMQNPWYATESEPADPQRRNLSLLAENISATIASEGKAPNTVEHFVELNRRLQLGLQQQQPQAQAQQQSIPAPKPQGAPAQPSIPNSGPMSAPIGSNRGGSTGKIQLTSLEAAMAKEWGMSPQEYHSLKGGPNV